MGLRIGAAILALFLGSCFLGSSAAVAQSDAKSNYDPVSVAHKAKSQSRAKAARSRSGAVKQSKQRGPGKTRDTAAAKAKSKSAKPPAKAEPPSASLRESYAAIPLAERIALQSNLIWTGDYDGPIDGEFSERLVDAVKAYQKRHKSKTTGVMSPKERADLAAAVQPSQEELGWRLVEDPVTGARVGMPAAIATKAAPAVSGTRWSSAQGQLQIATFRIDTGATLEAVFEQQQKQRHRRVTRHVLHDNDFVVSGTQGLKKFYVRAFAQNGEVRGITILYDQAMSGTIDPIVSAMSSAFVPFASYALASTRSTGVPRRKVEYGTGLVVSADGHVVTARHVVEGCQVIAIPRLGNAERLAEDKDGELALLRVYGARNLAAIGLPGAASGGERVTLVGIADPQAQGGGADAGTAPARLTAVGQELALEPAPAPGFSGAAALDGEGRLVGIAISPSSVVAGNTGAPQATVVPLAKLRSFLDANRIAPLHAHLGTERAKAAAVRVICVRK